MFKKSLAPIVARESDDVYRTYWNWCKTQVPTMVLGEEDHFVGMIAEADWKKAILSEHDNLTVGQITNYHCTKIHPENMYKDGRNIFAEKNFNYIPVVDDENNLVDLFTRERAFYNEYFHTNKLPRMHYANLVWAAAHIAKAHNYPAISVIEFGVAGGIGLLNLQFHAREIGRLLGIEIQVYGFDTGEGLPAYEIDYRDMKNHYSSGSYKMNVGKLQERLEKTQLVIGDIRNTGKSFFDKYKPAPIGVMAVDVDYYTSTVPVLEMLQTEYKNVLPFVLMYFDDIFRGYECVGENLAVKEFNIRNEGKINISPEGTERAFGFTPGGCLPSYRWQPCYKICHFFEHPEYSEKNDVKAQMPLEMRQFIL